MWYKFIWMILLYCVIWLFFYKFFNNTYNLLLLYPSLIILMVIIVIGFLFYSSPSKELIHNHIILEKNCNNGIIIHQLREIINYNIQEPQKISLTYYNQTIESLLSFKENKIILQLMNPLKINTVEIKSFTFNLGYINKNTLKKYHLPMYLESISYTIKQKDNFNYYGEVLNILSNFIPQIKNSYGING